MNSLLESMQAGHTKGNNSLNSGERDFQKARSKKYLKEGVMNSIKYYWLFLIKYELRNDDGNEQYKHFWFPCWERCKYNQTKQKKINKN